jgi:hypothetical protein
MPDLRKGKLTFTLTPLPNPQRQYLVHSRRRKQHNPILIPDRLLLPNSNRRPGRHCLPLAVQLLKHPEEPPPTIQIILVDVLILDPILHRRRHVRPLHDQELPLVRIRVRPLPTPQIRVPAEKRLDGRRPRRRRLQVPELPLLGLEALLDLALGVHVQRRRVVVGEGPLPLEGADLSLAAVVVAVVHRARDRGQGL